MKRLALCIVFGVAMSVVGLLTACGGRSLAPVINKSPDRIIPATAVAQPNDSIYSVAWRYGLDAERLIKLNGLRKPFAVNSGQRLRLRGAATASTGAAKKKSTTATATKPTTATQAKPSTKKAATKPATRNSSNRLRAPRKWRRPAQGKIIGAFSRAQGRNGVQIAGKDGSAIRATAAGEVVYAGEGLRGYGKLIIVKHSADFLSAYAHNRKILVGEGQNVRAGQQIAQMGNSGAKRTMLHFEIRKKRQPGRSVEVFAEVSCGCVGGAK